MLELSSPDELAVGDRREGSPVTLTTPSRVVS